MKQAFLWSCPLLTFLLNAPLLFGQSGVEGMHSEDWHVRAATVRMIVAHPELLAKQSIKLLLVESLEREDEILSGKVIVQPSPFEDETYGDNYLSDLESAVFDIARNDNTQRAFDALINSSYNPDSEIGKAIGDRPENLMSLFLLAQSHGSGDRMNAAAGIAQILATSKSAAKAPITASQYREGKKLITSLATRDPDAPVRQQATEGLVRLADKEDVTVLQGIAANDPSGYRDDAGIMHFPIREVAAKGLASGALLQPKAAATGPYR